MSVKFVPYGSNEEMGVGAKIVGGLMVIGGGILIATGFGAGVGIAVMGSGLAMILSGGILLNTDIPKLDDKEKPESDPSIRGSKNQARPHGRIPVLFGRHRVYPDIVANPCTEIIDGKQYYTQLFCGGYKDCIIDTNTLKLGDTPLIDFSATKNMNSILNGADPVIRLEIFQNGERGNIYPNCVHEDVINAPLNKEIDGANGQKISGAVTRTTPNKTSIINVDIFFHSGLGKYNKDSKLVSTSLTVQAWYKKETDPDTKYQLFGFFNGNSNVISGAELKTKRCQITKSGLTPGQYTVKIERVTDDSTDTKIIDQVYIGSVRSIKSVRPIRAVMQNNLTIIAMRVLATGQLNGMLDRFNYIATAKHPVYSGNGSGHLHWLNTAETCNPASALLYALQGRPAQQKVNADDIDWPSLEAFYLWCEEHEYTCNAYLSQSVTIAELIRMIGRTARADILRIDSKVSVVQDIERPAHMQLFTPKNTISYSVTMLKGDIPEAIALRYIDADAGYDHNELSVYNTSNGNRVKEPDSIQKMELWGITNSEQARRIGMYSYGCLKNRPFVHSIEVDIEYLICNKGDWIQYAGDIALTGSAQGRIKGTVWQDGVCIGIDTDEPIEMLEGNQYAVRIRLYNGEIILKEVVFSPGRQRNKSMVYNPTDDGDLYAPLIGEMYAIDEEDNVYYEPLNVIFFTEPFAESKAPKAGDIYAFGIRGYEVIDLIITDILPERDFKATLTCVEYSPEIFGVDSPDFVLPEFENKITPFSGAMDSGLIKPSDWKHFAVYNDNDEEPPRPTGEGQNDGWHYSKTFRSIWESAKMAVTVDVGEWGQPVRIKATRNEDDITPIWLSLEPQNKLLESDADGKILAGLLPFTSQARLHMWSGVLSTGVTFSLTGAPAGISIHNTSGLVTVNANATLGDVNNITVNATYQGEVYTSVLKITRDTRSYAPRYLGTVNALTTSNATVTIIKGPVQGSVLARQGDYVLTIDTTNGRSAGSVFQWSGIAWEYREPDRYADLYIRCFKDGLDVPGLAYDTGWFGAIFARQLIAQHAFIENLAAQDLTISGNSLFLGAISSGPLLLTNDEPVGQLYNIEIGATTLSIPVRSNILGHYGNIPIIAIKKYSDTNNEGIFYYEWYGSYGNLPFNKIYHTETATVITNEGNEIEVAFRGYNSYTPVWGKEFYPNQVVNWINNNNYPPQDFPTNLINRLLTERLTYQFTSEGKRTFRLVDIPDYEPATPGTVYRSGNSLCIKV